MAGPVAGSTAAMSMAFGCSWLTAREVLTPMLGLMCTLFVKFHAFSNIMQLIPLKIVDTKNYMVVTSDGYKFCDNLGINKEKLNKVAGNIYLALFSYIPLLLYIYQLYNL